MIIDVKLDMELKTKLEESRFTKALQMHIEYDSAIFDVKSRRVTAIPEPSIERSGNGFAPLERILASI